MKRLPFYISILACILLVGLAPSVTHAQTYTMGHEEFISWEEFISDYFEERGIDEQESDQKFGQEETIEYLEDLHHHPFNINLATQEELLLIPFLSKTQVDSILQYRSRKHLFRSLGELQWISGIPYETRCRLSLFTFAGDTIDTPSPILPRLYKGKHEIISRLDVPLYKRAGDKDYTKAELQSNPNRVYLGNRLANTTRYRYRWHQDVTYGLTLQKDTGEPFASQKNYPYDYTSFYFYFRPKNRRYSIWLGDFNMHFGQGLCIGHSFFFGPLQALENSSVPRSRIRPHTSSDEINYFRGAAGMMNLGKYSKLSVLVSFRKLDGRLEGGDTVTSLKTDGLHRTQREIQRRRVLGNSVVGSHFSYNREYGHIGATLYGSFYSKTLYPALHEYNRYYLRGKSAAGLSTDYAWRSRHWNFYGETGCDKEFHLATTNTIRYTFNSSTSVLLQERSFSTQFVSPLGNTLQENSRIQNEHAVLLGTIFQPFNKTKVSTYAEYYYHPRPTFRADLPSHGIQFFLQGKYNASSKWTLALRYKVKAEQQNLSGYKNIMQYLGTHRIRLTSYYNTPRFNLNIAGDFAAVTRQAQPTTYGYMISLRNRFDISSQISAHTFASIFFTDDYAARLYAYEPQLQYAASFPTFAYHGARLAGLIQWKFCQKAYLALRYGWLHYFNRDHISSGTQEISSSSKNDISIQIAWHI